MVRVRPVLTGLLILTACGGGGSRRPSDLPPPTGVSATPGIGENTVDWTPLPAATGYNVHWATSPGVTKTTGTRVAVTAPPFPHGGLTVGTTYHYVVTSVRKQTESEESAEVSATPRDPPMGSLDPTFGGNGCFTPDNAGGGSSRDAAFGVSLDSAGRILVTGGSLNASGHQVMATWRLNDDGTASGDDAVAWSLAIDGRGRLVAAGWTGPPGSPTDMAVWRIR